MPLDPQLTPILEAAAPFTSVDWNSIDVATARQAAAQSVVPAPVYHLASVEDFYISTREHRVPVRLYRPDDEQHLPVILFMHGGGWVLGSLDAYDGICRKLALDSGCPVLAVDYRLAPEYPYPAALNDCFAVLAWLVDNGTQMGLDPSRIALAGDSAGANLSAALTVMSRDRGGPAIRHQALLYPATDRSCSSPSFAENDRYLLTPAMMRWYWKHYIGERSDTEVALALPAQFRDLSGLPGATVITAEYDPLRDEGEAYAASLARAGVPTELVRVPGQIHGFISMLGMVDAAEYWLGYVARRLRDAVTPSSAPIIARTVAGSVSRAKRTRRPPTSSTSIS